MSLTPRTTQQAQPTFGNPLQARRLAATRRRVASLRAAFAQTLDRGQLGPVVGQRDQRRPEPPFSGPPLH